MRFKEKSSVTWSQKARAWHHHRSDTPTSPRAIYVIKSANANDIMPSVLISMFLLFIFQVVFYSSYCLDIYVCSENYIKVRDAAISLFNQGKAMEEIQPIPFIKNFLLRYVDEAALQRRQSQAAEDDNPPSPTMVGGTYITFVNTKG